MSDEELSQGQANEPETKEEEEVELSEEEERLAKLQEAIEVDREVVGPLRYKLRISVPREVLDERMREQLEEFRQEAVIPGFRKGRAPMPLVEKRFAPEIEDQMTGQMVGSSFMAACKKESLDPLGDPEVWVKVEEERTDDQGVARRVEVEKLVGVSEAIDVLKLPKEGPFEYACEVEVRPQFELPALEKIPIQIKSHHITDEDVDREIQRLLAFRGEFVEVAEGPVEKDDLLHGDVKMYVEGRQVETLENFDLPARGTVIKRVPVPQWGEAVIGKKKGETAQVETTIPEDHANADYRGKPGKFEITIHQIKRLRIPELTEELMKELGFQSRDELRHSVKERMESQVEQARQDRIRAAIQEYLIEHVPMELPEALSNRQTDRLLMRRMIELYRRGIPEAEISKRLDDMRTSARQDAVRDLKLSFVMEKIAEKMEIGVSEEEVNTAIAEIAAQQNRRFDRVRDDLSRNEGLTVLYTHIRDRKIADRLAHDAELVEAAE